MCARNGQKLEAAAEAIRTNSGADVFAQALDGTDAGGVHDFTEAVAKKFGSVDICVTNAGGPPAKGFLAASIEDWRKAVDANFLSTDILSAKSFSHAAQPLGTDYVTSITPSSRCRIWHRTRARPVGLVKSPP
jgi:3-oxoacyl-[acyl-carrier protein] reductase